MERFAGRYLLLRQLGQGGMGAVYLARDLSTSTECALKRLDPRMLRVAPDSLRNEFEVLARLRHPAIVAVHELGFAPDGTPFYTMEYVPGLASDRVLKPGDWPTLSYVATQVTQGLEALHGAGIIHGDLKPTNLLVVPGDAAGDPPADIRLVDFGLAGLLDRERERHRGTVGFAAPEIARGESPSIASDLYGLGATLYALAVGAGSLTRASTRSGIHRQQRAAPSAARLEEAGAPAPLAQLILRLLAPTPGERPSDARELRRELERVDPRARRDLARRLQTTVVVGRDRELARLDRFLAAESADPRIIVVTGAPGIGKSALLGEAGVRAVLSGRSVYRMSCAAFESPGELAKALLRRLAVDARAASDEHEVSREALRLIGLETHIPEDHEFATLIGAAARWARMIQKLGKTPVVLLDDWERAEPLSSALVLRMALEPDADTIRWVWASRAEDASIPEEQRVLFASGHAYRMTLGTLERAGADRLVAARLSHNPPAELSDSMWRLTAGHPGLVVEFLRAAASRRALLEGDAGLMVDAAALDALVLPGDFEATLLARLETLDEPARDLAAGLSIWARPVTPAELRLVAPEADDAAIERLLVAGLATRDAAQRLALCTPGLQRRIHAGLTDSRRRAGHRAALAQPQLLASERFVHQRGAGEAREALVTAAAEVVRRRDERLALEAVALAEAEVPEAAPEWQERAATMLIDVGRQDAAIPLLERSLAAEPDSPSRPNRWHQLTRAQFRANLFEDLALTHERALAENPPPPFRSLLVTSEVARLSAIGRHDESRRLADEAMALAEADGLDAAYAPAAMNLSGKLANAGNWADAKALARRGLEAYGRLGNEPGVVRGLGLLGYIAFMEQDFAECERCYREGVERARRMRHRLALEELLVGLAAILMQMGRWSEGRELQAEAERVSLEDSRPLNLGNALANLAQIDGLTGRVSLARRRGAAAVRIARRYSKRRLEVDGLRSLAQVYRISGRMRRAESVARRALARALETGSAFGVEWCRIEFGRCCAKAGRWREAEDVWSRAVEARTPAGSAAQAILSALIGRAAARRRDFGTAATRLQECEGWLASHFVPYAAAHALQLRAEIALITDRIEEGIELARRTLAAYNELPAPPDRALAALDFARLAIAADAEASTPVDDWLQDAAETFGRLGDHTSRERALALSVDWLRQHRGPGVATASRERGLINSVSQLIHSLSDFHELTQRAMQMAVEQLHAERGVLLVIDSNTGELVPLVEHGTVDGPTRNSAMSYSRRAVERVTKGGGSVLYSDAPSQPDAISESVLDLGLLSIVCVPLFFGGRVIGAVYLDDSRRSDTFNPEDRGLLEGFAQLISVAMEKSRGQEEIYRTNEALVGENMSLRREVAGRFQPRNFVSTSSAMQQVLSIVERAAQIPATVLLTGENGTGKEMIARILHHGGKRRLGAFVPVNCGAIPETLLESELFGILANVATGVRAREGRFVQAHGGTLFLDEIGDMPLKQQVALLNALSSREITPVGGGRPIPVDARIIAATNRDLRRRVEEGAFREDLFYRLNVIPIEIPPLRERKSDIPALAHHFANHFAQQQEREVPALSPEFLAALMQSDWAGNVRELQNYVERVMALTPGHVLYPNPLPRDLEARAPRVRSERGRRLSDLVADLERRLIREAMERCDGNQSRAARDLGLTEQSMRYRLKRYSMTRSRRNLRTRKKRR